VKLQQVKAEPVLKNISELPIGVFDSGIGGLTVAAALHRRLPGEDIIYLGDTARVPYGTKSDQMVRRYAIECALFMLNQGVKLIVVACNTATAVALPHLRELLRVPMIGVVEPGVEAALKQTGSGRIGVIGTPSTIASGAYQSRLRELAPAADVYGQACPLLVPLTEEGRLEGAIVDMVLKDYLSGMRQKNVEALILGCTHYPLLKPAIARFMGAGVELVDSAEATAHAVEDALLREGLLRTHGRGRVKCYVTDVPRQFNRLAKLFFGEKVSAIKTKVHLQALD